MSSTHHISRLQYRVACPDEGQAFELRNLLSAIVTEELAATMEEVSARYITDDQFIRIQKLEIDLSSSSLHSLGSQLSALFGYTLEEELRKRVRQSDPDDLDGHGQEQEAFFYFVQTGVLPHWAAVLHLDIDEVASRILSHQPKRLLVFLRQNASNKAVWGRIDAQLSLEIREDIICLVPELAATFTLLRRDYAALRSTNPLPETPAEMELLLELMVSVTLRNAVGILQGLILPNILLQHLQQELAPYSDSDTVPDRSVLTCLDIPIHFENIPVDPIPVIQAAERAFAKSEMNTAHEISFERVVVHSSGVVLLHAFLKPLFTELLLMHDGEWTDRMAQQRAVHLVHYLATGLLGQPEWNLVLEKLLCGLTPDMPLERDVVLTEVEIAECNELLTAVIRHWTVLKNTSSPGLRETFFKRDGMLEETEKGWILRVERKTQDVLIEALPWGFTMIQLAWNEYLIEVIW